MSAPPIPIIEFETADDMDMNLLRWRYAGSNKPSFRRLAQNKRGTRPNVTPTGAASTRSLDVDNFERSESSLRLPSDTDTDKPPMPPKRTRSTTTKSQQKLSEINKEASKESENDDSFENLKSRPGPDLVVVNETRNMSQHMQRRKSGLSSALVAAFSDSKSSADSQITPNRRKNLKGIREKSLRNVLCNKNKLEKELCISNVFHFVLHKCPMEEFQTPKDGSKMPLGTFLKMKQASERHALQNSLEGDGDTWQQESLEFLELPRHSGLAGEETESLKGDEDEEDCRSVVSLTVQDLGESYSKSDAPTASLTEEVESQTLSLSMNDMHPDMDEKDKINFKEHVIDFPVVDPSGRKGAYVGSISKSSGLPCGTGSLEYHDTGEIFEGRFVHGFWSGYGKCIYPSGNEYTGFFEVNIRHGHGIMNYPDGRSFDGTYINGLKVEGRMTYQDGSMYIGRWLKGARHGKGTYTFLNGSVFLGEFCSDTIHGTGVLTWSNGGRYVGQWRNGVRHGHGTEFRPDGTIRFNGVWIDGQREKSSP
jgi:hypothetical protein